ncbi:protein of unknown function [Pseudomonas mediterranea]
MMNAIDDELALLLAGALDDGCSNEWHVRLSQLLWDVLLQVRQPRKGSRPC